MGRRLIYALIASAVLLAAGYGCTGGGQNAAAGPEETVSAFYGALAEGDFDKASRLCDTLAMGGYIGRYASEWDRMAMQADSCTCAIACSLMTTMKTVIVSCGKKDDRTEVRYSLEASGYPQKDKKAVLRKEEGEWKIEAVTDDN
jgi:hypothetical protein